MVRIQSRSSQPCAGPRERRSTAARAVWKVEAVAAAEGGLCAALDGTLALPGTCVRRLGVRRCICRQLRKSMHVPALQPESIGGKAERTRLAGRQNRPAEPPTPRLPAARLHNNHSFHTSQASPLSSELGWTLATLELAARVRATTPYLKTAAARSPGRPGAPSAIADARWDAGVAEARAGEELSMKSSFSAIAAALLGHDFGHPQHSVSPPPPPKHTHTHTHTHTNGQNVQAIRAGAISAAGL